MRQGRARWPNGLRVLANCGSRCTEHTKNRAHGHALFCAASGFSRFLKLAMKVPMDRQGLLTFLRKHRLCVQASVAEQSGPQAAVVGYAVSERLELVFDTLSSTRKAHNLRRDPRIALVIWDGEQTLQLEGLADEPSGEDLLRLKQIYLAAFPDGVERERWPGITYVRVRPHWARFSDFGAGGSVLEFDETALRA